MKKITLLFLFITAALWAQIPSGYYDGAQGLTGAALKTKLSQIITNGHKDNGYDGLWTGYKTTDIDNFYEKDGTVLDIYSENPTGKDPYNFIPGQKQCGNYSNEGDCYNREHVIPQSFFYEKPPMHNDINFIRPTDGKVNGMRSNFPYGTVGKTDYVSKNGSKLGSSTSAGYGGTVFEPIDEFKGDIARMIFYFVTRYESQLSTFKTNPMLGTTAFPGLQTWELNVLLAWAKNDPVSKVEIDRNNASYAYQGNRNPFIDHPEYVDAIWGTPVADTTPPSAATNLTAANPTASTVELSWTAATDDIGVSTYDIYVNGALAISVPGNQTTATVTGLSPRTAYEFYIIAKDAAGNASDKSNTATATTTDTPANPDGTNCVTENFDNIPGKFSNYDTRSWTSNGLTWTATDARTDQEINGKAIAIRQGSLSATASPNGIGSLTVTTQLKFSGPNGNLILKVNGNKVGEIPYSAQTKTTTINGINLTGNVAISIEKTTDANRVAIDDLSWTCYAPLATATAHAEDGFRVYPNPVKNGILVVSGLSSKTDLEIYSLTGQLVYKASQVSDKQQIQLPRLAKGVYILKAGAHSKKIIIE